MSYITVPTALFVMMVIWLVGFMVMVAYLVHRNAQEMTDLEIALKELKRSTEGKMKDIRDETERKIDVLWNECARQRDDKDSMFSQLTRDITDLEKRQHSLEEGFGLIRNSVEKAENDISEMKGWQIVLNDTFVPSEIKCDVTNVESFAEDLKIKKEVETELETELETCSDV